MAREHIRTLRLTRETQEHSESRGLHVVDYARRRDRLASCIESRGRRLDFMREVIYGTLDFESV